MPRFKFIGFGRDTNRKRTHIYRAANIKEALKKASQDGTIVDISQTEIFPDEPATENQKRYARELNLNFPENITESDMYMLLSEIAKDKKYQILDAKLPPTEKQLAFIKNKKKKIPPNITRRELSKIIDKIINDELDEWEKKRDNYIENLS